ncbi:MAG: cytochrome b/b6 domain-containing protein [Desulfobacterales bacterium]
MSGKMINIYLYTRYERFWHWLQAALIILLLLTGFEINGNYSLFGFEKAVKVHNFAGITWLIAFAFFVFWLFTTGEWKQYVPTTKKMFAVIRHYAMESSGVNPIRFPSEKKPSTILCAGDHLLLQLLLPVQMISGFLYWGYNSWTAWGISGLSLGPAAFVHTAYASAILSFLVVHVYMTTTGHTVTTYIRA